MNVAYDIYCRENKRKFKLNVECVPREV